MLPEKSVLLEQITTAINNNSCKKNTAYNGHPDAGTDPVEISAFVTDKNYFSYARSLESIKKLEERVQALEDQNDHLLYFVHYLYKNFPDLVRDILHQENYEFHEIECPGKSRESLFVIKNDHPSLTRRELEILQLLVKGLCAKEIASMLFISETTVITHKKNLKEKFHARNTVELISKAFTLLFKTTIPNH